MRLFNRGSGAFKTRSHPGDHDDDAAAVRISRSLHVPCGVKERPVETVAGILVMRRHAAERVDETISVAGETLNHLGCVVKSHHCHFVFGLKAIYGFSGCVAYLFTERIEASAPVYEEKDR